jgi:hypothetical protein
MNRSTNEALDRRVHARIRLQIPVLIKHPLERRGAGLTFDLSAWGALVLCSRAFAVGEEVSLVLRVNPGSEASRRLSGDIVRVLSLAEAGEGWSHAFAMEFDEPLDEPWVPLLLT